MAAEHPNAVRWEVVPTTAWTLAEGGDAVVMDMASGLPLELGATGSLIWEILLDGRTPEDDLAADPPVPTDEEALVAEVAALYSADADAVGPDVRTFLATLAARDVLRRA